VRFPGPQGGSGKAEAVGFRPRCVPGLGLASLRFATRRAPASGPDRGAAFAVNPCSVWGYGRLCGRVMED
jgi:hypothetical protein